MSLEHPTEKTCFTCRFSQFRGSRDFPSWEGDCRVGGPSRGDPKWPIVTREDWCGRWKALEVE
jgi:hypothetical protein